MLQQKLNGISYRERSYFTWKCCWPVTMIHVSWPKRDLPKEPAMETRVRLLLHFGFNSSTWDSRLRSRARSC